MPKTIDRFEGGYRWLSNFSERGGCWPTLEHQFQAMKATNVADAIFVMSAPTPGEAKKRGRQIKIVDDWDDVRIDVMYELLMTKFSDPELAQELLDTGDAILIEGNTWGDKFWGVCDGKGLNNLGQLLMIVRDEVAEKVS